MRGTVKNIIANKMFGFIRIDGARTELFFHREDFEGHWEDLAADVANPANKVEVEFEKLDTPKGPRASKVRRVDWPNQVG